MSDDLHVIDDGEGSWYAVAGGHIRKLYFLRLILSHYGIDLLDLGFGISCMDEIKHGMCVLVDRDDSSTWRYEEREMMEDDDGFWSYEWDQIYFLDEKGDIPITYWSAG